VSGEDSDSENPEQAESVAEELYPQWSRYFICRYLAVYVIAHLPNTPDDRSSLGEYVHSCVSVT
jgi:hypothetical protein